MNDQDERKQFKEALELVIGTLGFILLNSAVVALLGDTGRDAWTQIVIGTIVSVTIWQALEWRRKRK